MAMEGQGHGDLFSLDSLKGSRAGTEINPSDLPRRFFAKAIDLARAGQFGALKTRKSNLKDAFLNLVTMLERPEIPVLIYGEVGSGKRRIIDEYLCLQNFYRRLHGREAAVLKVYQGSFLNVGFTRNFASGKAGPGDLIYIENIELMSKAAQAELLSFLERRKKNFERGAELPRLLLSTERALSLSVIKKEFSRDLFVQITGVAVFVPSLAERADDMPHLIAEMASEMTKARQFPPAWLVDVFARQLWPKNFEDLKKVLASGLARNPTLASWTEADLPESFRGVSAEFQRAEAPDVTLRTQERVRLRQALIKAGGDRSRAAGFMGLGRVDFLKKLFEHGLR